MYCYIIHVAQHWTNHLDSLYISSKKVSVSIASSYELPEISVKVNDTRSTKWNWTDDESPIVWPFWPPVLLETRFFRSRLYRFQVSQNQNFSKIAEILVLSIFSWYQIDGFFSFWLRYVVFLFYLKRKGKKYVTYK